MFVVFSEIKDFVGFDMYYLQQILINRYLIMCLVKKYKPLKLKVFFGENWSVGRI